MGDKIEQDADDKRADDAANHVTDHIRGLAHLAQHAQDSKTNGSTLSAAPTLAGRTITTIRRELGTALADANKANQKAAVSVYEAALTKFGVLHGDVEARPVVPGKKMLGSLPRINWNEVHTQAQRAPTIGAFIARMKEVYPQS